MPQTVIIVGASTGIGKALSFHLVSLGYNVVISARSVDKGLKNKAEMEKMGKGQVEFVPGDCGKHEDMKQLWEKSLARFGKVEHLILNAWGSANPEPSKGHWWQMVDAEHDYWDQDIKTGLTGQMFIMRLALTYWRKQNIPGNIIWTGSGVGFPGVSRTHYIYAMVKAAMIRMAEVFELSQKTKEYEGPRIRMNVVAPGIVYIESRGDTLEEATRRYGGAERLARGGGWTPMPVLLDTYVHLMTDPTVSGLTLQVAGDKGNVRVYTPNTRHPVYTKVGAGAKGKAKM